MPYKTGDYPEGFDGEEVSSLKELVEAAQKHLTEETAAVRIMDPSLDPDTMNRALQHSRGGLQQVLERADIHPAEEKP